MAVRDNKHIPLKIHLCCGDVYLDGYVNIDGTGRLASPNNENLTTLDKYYKRKTHEFNEVLYDVKLRLPDEYHFKDVDEVLMISAFEHFRLPEVEELIYRVYFSLNTGGVFRFDFPDIEETVRKYRNNPEYMVRLIYGSQKNEFGFHKHGYTKSTIKKILGVRKWRSIKFGDIVKHSYPMIGVTATK